MGNEFDLTVRSGSLNIIQMIKQRTDIKDLQSSIASTRRLIRAQRSGLECKRVTARITVDNSLEEIDPEQLELAERRFRTKWRMQSLFKEKEVYVPADCSTLKLLYGTYC